MAPGGRGGAFLLHEDVRAGGVPTVSGQRRRRPRQSGADGVGAGALHGPLPHRMRPDQSAAAPTLVHLRLPPPQPQLVRLRPPVPPQARIPPRQLPRRLHQILQQGQ